MLAREDGDINKESMNNLKVLVVEDENDIAELIKLHLSQQGAEVSICNRGDLAIEAVKQQQPDFILLDLMLPGIHGITICRYLKDNKEFQHIPLIILSALGTEEDIVRGLEIGADDYIAKPFSAKILIARMRAVLKRYQDREGSQQSEIIEHAKIKLDLSKHKVWVEGEEVNLTATEFAILALLASKIGFVFTRSQIVNSIRGTNHAITDRAVDFQMVGLRKKLSTQGKLVETVRGVGYRLSDI